MVSLYSTPHIVPNRLVIPLPLSSRRKATSSALRVEMTSASNGAEYRCFITDANGDMGSTRVATVKLDTRDWQMEYNTSGLRTRRISDDKTYRYIYAGDKLMRMTVGDDILDFSYDANGAPLTMTCNGTVYYYITNLQGDVMKLERADGGSGAQYAYDAWGNIIAMSGTLAELNPLRYRGYVYDQETGFYYLQSRYYDPAVGRFISADSYATTGQGILGCNMFVYCLNSPLQHIDIDGQSAALVGELGGAAMLPLLDGPLPFGDVLFSILVICSLGRYLREKNAAVSKVTVNSIDWGKGDHNHILKGTNRKHVKGWKRFGIDPDGGNSWPMLLPILKEVIENADKTESMTLLNGNTIIR